MPIDRRYIPDVSVISVEDGNEIMIVEVKLTFPSNSQEKAVITLREYMKTFYTKIGLLVTPNNTLIMKKAYLDSEGTAEEGYYSSFISSDSLFGEVIQGSTPQQFEDYIYHKILEMVESINTFSPLPKVYLIDKNLPFLLENTKVIRGRG